MTARAVALFAVLMALGCAREARRAEIPLTRHYGPAAAAVPASAPSWTSGQPLAAPPLASAPLALQEGPFASLPGFSSEPPTPIVPELAPRPAAPPPRAMSPGAIPEGERCLALLKELGVSHQRLTDKRGVVTPVQIDGPIAGIDYTSPTGPMVCDCRLAVALAWAAPEFRRVAITRVHFSGAYSYRMSKVGRLSYHAYGLALDVHEVTVGLGTRISVERDFSRGLGDGCSESAPTLNELTCRLKRSGLFKELLTPDYNADHQNHLHFGVAPLSLINTGPTPILPPGLMSNRPRREAPPVSATPPRSTKQKPRQATERAPNAESIQPNQVSRSKAKRKNRGRKLNERGAGRNGARGSVL